MPRNKNLWTKAEQKSAKIIVNMVYKEGSNTIEALPLIIRPTKMTKKDFNTLTNLICLYGKSR